MRPERSADVAPATSRPEPLAHGHHILVCLDRSPGSEASLPYVLGMAKTFASSITLAHVMERAQPAPRTSDVLGWEISRREAGAYLERVQKETALALERAVDVRLEQGQPAERIVDLAREIGADLIVVSSHGQGEGTQNLGSTVQQVLALARSSVFIVHPAMLAPALPKRLLVPLDGSLRTESVLPTAARIARAYGAELLLVHIVQEPVPTLVLNAIEDLELARQLAANLELSGNRYLQSLRDRLTHESSTVRTLVVRHPNERQALLDISRREQVDLIVLSAHGSACDPVHSFGSVTTDLLIHSQLPMLVLQDLPEQDFTRNADVHQSSAPPLRASYTPEGE